MAQTTLHSKYGFVVPTQSCSSIQGRYIHTQLRAHMHACMHAHTHTLVSLNAHLYRYTCVCVRARQCAHAHAYAHTHTQTHTHIYLPWLFWLTLFCFTLAVLYNGCFNGCFVSLILHVGCHVLLNPLIPLTTPSKDLWILSHWSSQIHCCISSKQQEQYVLNQGI